MTLLRGTPFWIEPLAKHDKQWESHTLDGEPGYCCFNHIVGLPNKTGIGPCPLFDYELDLYDRMFNRGQRRLIIKKATGLGITEYFLRLILWLCLKDDSWRGSQVLVLTGPNRDLAIGLIRRMKRILFSKLGITEVFEFKQQSLELNGVEIEAYPSHKLNAIRSLERPTFILLDEFDFFEYDADDPDNPRAIAERYSAKSDPYMALVSTPNLPGGLLESLENDVHLHKPEVSSYSLVELPWEVGKDKIYTNEMIGRAMIDGSFEREYKLKYGYGLGNCFIASFLNNALERARLTYSLQTYQLPRFGQLHYRSMAVDPGYSSSKFALLLTEWLPEPRLIRIFEAAEYDSADFGDMLNKCHNRIREYEPNKILVDGSQIEFIRALKRLVGENDEGYDDEIERLRKWGYEEIEIPSETHMLIVPVNFGYKHMSRRMIEHARQWVEQKDALVIEREQFPELVSQLYMAKQKETDGSLDKTKHSLDLVDAFIMSLLYYKIQT